MQHEARPNLVERHEATAAFVLFTVVAWPQDARALPLIGQRPAFPALTK